MTALASLSRRHRLAVTIGIIVAVTVTLRSPVWGNPLFGDDEEFYPLVGARLLHGALPYLDIWDRKPFGLFALFAAMQAGGGDPALVTQLFASAFAGGTALVIYCIAAQRVAWRPALLAALFYLVMLEPLAGGATQTAVFYNLLPTVAAWLVSRTRPALALPSDLVRAGAAMLLCGLAIQIKTNAAFEGAAIGAWLAVRLVRHDRSMRSASIIIALFAVGVAPTGAVAAGYWLAGHGAEWWFANVQSQFLKRGGADAASLHRLGVTLIRVSPLLLGAGFAARWSRADERRSLSLAWAAAALVDALAIGNFWTFYWLPFAAPASVLSADLFARPRWGWRAFWLFTLPAALTTVPLESGNTARAKSTFGLTLAKLPSDVPYRCMLTYDAPVAYLQASHACLVTPFVFPDHLRSSTEARALPVDAALALRDALARRPGTVLTVDHSIWTLRNQVNDRLISSALVTGYRRIAVIPQWRHSGDREVVVVWRRRDLMPPLPAR